MSGLPVATSAYIIGGTPVTMGTRAPAQSLVEFLAVGDSSDAFLAAFPSVKCSQVVGLLDMAADLAVTATA